MARGEFENREREELGVSSLPGIGELSEELAAERGELDSYSTRQLTGEVPADMQVQAGDKSSIQRTGIGSPKVDYNVRSIYDSRPLNGRDFNLWFTGFLLDETDVEPGVLRRMWQVPNGLVAVIRGFTILQSPGASVGDMFDGTVELLVDNAVKEPQRVRVGPNFLDNGISQEPIPYHSGEQINTFVVVEENAFVGINWNPIGLGTTFFGADGSFARFGFYGQFLQKTGVPANFQVANKAGQAYTADTLSADFGPSGADFLTRRRRQYDPFAAIPLVNSPK